MRFGREEFSAKPGPKGRGTRAGRSILRKSLIPLAAIGLVFSGLGLYLSFAHGGVERTLKIGFQKSPPYHFPDANGNPTGPAVDVVKEAARRQNISLEWVYTPYGPAQALRGGTVDLRPIMGVLSH